MPGSAAGTSSEESAQRAYFELLERVSVVEVQRLGEPLPVRDLAGRSSHHVEPRTLLGEPLGGSDSWAVRVYVKPFIRWIWFGALMMMAGGIVAAADRRFRRKLEAEVAEAPAPVRNSAS